MNWKMQFFILFTVPWLLYAQTEIPEPSPLGKVYIGCVVQNWRLEKQKPVVNQISFPIILNEPIGDHFILRITHSPAQTKWDTAKISGLSDTWVQGTYLLSSRKAMLHIGLGMPTGKTRLSNAEYELAKHISTNFFRYQVPVYGQGFCAQIGGALAFELTQTVVVGVGAQYVAHGAYHPVRFTYRYDQTEKVFDKPYRPGNELIAQAGVDVLINEETKCIVDGEVARYERDVLDGKEVYKAGERATFGLGLYRRFQSQYFWGYAVYRMKSKPVFVQGLSMEEVQQYREGPQLELDLVYKAVAFREGGFFLLGEGRYYPHEKASAFPGGTLIGGGVSVQFQIFEGALADLRAKFFGGTFRGNIIQQILGMDFRAGLSFVLL